MLSSLTLRQPSLASLAGSGWLVHRRLPAVTLDDRPAQRDVGQPSRPDVGGTAPVTTHSWNAASSRLKPLSCDTTSSVRQDLAEAGSPPCISRTAGSLRRNGEPNARRSRRSGA